MPYASNSELPKAVKDALPAAAQSTFRTIVNAALKQYDGDEEKAFATAWSALKRQGWEKTKDGTWHKTTKSAEAAAAALDQHLLDIPIAKVDDARHLVFGWANVAIRKDGEQLEDLHGDLIDIADLEDAAYQFNLDFRTTGEMHQGEAVGHLVESFLVTQEKLEKMGLPTDALPQGWWVGFYVPDEAIFAKVRSGDYAMFSIQGLALPEEV